MKERGTRAEYDLLTPQQAVNELEQMRAAFLLMVNSGEVPQLSKAFTGWAKSAEDIIRSLHDSYDLLPSTWS